jgi:hypothetical protein
MTLDASLQVANAYAPTSDSGSLLFQSYIDRLVAQEDGAGQDICIYGKVKTTATSAGSATIRAVAVGNPTDATFNSGTLAGGGNVILADTGTIAYGTWLAGYQFFRAKYPRPALQSTLEDEASNDFLRYLTVGFIIATANLTAGAFDAWFTYGSLQDNIAYPAGYSFP